MLKLNCTSIRTTFSILIDGLSKSGKTQHTLNCLIKWCIEADAFRLFMKMKKKGKLVF